MISIPACAISHSLGANLLVAGAVRARFYAKYKITLRQVAAATVFNSFTFAVGLSTLAVAVGEEPETVEEVAEPFLVRMGFLARTPRGRVATPAAWAHLGLGTPSVGRRSDVDAALFED